MVMFEQFHNQSSGFFFKQEIVMNLFTFKVVKKKKKKGVPRIR